MISILTKPNNVLTTSGFGGSPSVQRNNLGQIVGITNTEGVVLFDPQTNEWTDITDSIAGLGTGGFSSIDGFNDRGEFVGLVFPAGVDFGVVGYFVSPVPEPSLVALLLSAASVMLMLRRRKQG